MGKYAVPMKVVRIVKKVQKHILEEPKRLEMGSWAESLRDFKDCESDSTYNDMKKLFPVCGTTACIAGWVTILSNPKKDKHGFYILPNKDYESFARNALGLTDSDEELRRLVVFRVNCYDEAYIKAYGPGSDYAMFYHIGWPEPFKSKYIKELDKHKPSKKILAKITAARLEHFITTGN